MKTIRLLLLFLLIAPIGLHSQKRKNKSVPPTVVLEDSLFHGLQWRNIGPFRGGRSVASTGVVGQPMTYYMGTVGGGIWKTTDDGITWNNISDGFLRPILTANTMDVNSSSVFVASKTLIFDQDHCPGWR